MATVTGWTADEWASTSPPQRAETTIPHGVPCARLANLILAPKQEAQRIATYDALVIANKGSLVWKCFVRDITSLGARLEFQDAPALPTAFNLTFDGKTLRRCHVKWRIANEVGVSFNARKRPEAMFDFPFTQHNPSLVLSFQLRFVRGNEHANFVRQYLAASTTVLYTRSRQSIPSFTSSSATPLEVDRAHKKPKLGRNWPAEDAEESRKKADWLDGEDHA